MLLPEHSAEEIKAPGDAVMLRGEDPKLAAALGARVSEEVGARHGHPAVRVDIHTDSAVERNWRTAIPWVPEGPRAAPGRRIS